MPQHPPFTVTLWRLGGHPTIVDSGTVATLDAAAAWVSDAAGACDISSADLYATATPCSRTVSGEWAPTGGDYWVAAIGADHTVSVWMPTTGVSS